MCSSPSLRSVWIGRDCSITMHDFFYSVLADNAEHSKIENLTTCETVLSEHPTASRNLALFICKVPHLKSLTFQDGELHDDFYQTVASSRLSAKVENLDISGIGLTACPVASHHLAKFICKMSHLKSLAISCCDLHDNFYQTVAESVGSSAKVENLDISGIELTACPVASHHLAKFICKMSHLKSLAISYCDLHDDFYQTVAKSVGSSAKIRNLNMDGTNLSGCPEASRHAAQFICKMPHLKSLDLRDCQFHEDFYETAASVESSAKSEFKTLEVQGRRRKSLLAGATCTVPTKRARKQGNIKEVGDQSSYRFASLSELTVDDCTLRRRHPFRKIFDSVKRLTISIRDSLDSVMIQSLHGLQGVTKLTIQGEEDKVKRPYLKGDSISVALVGAFPELLEITLSDLDIQNANMKLILESLRATQNNYLQSVRVTRCKTDKDLDTFMVDLKSSFQVEVEHGEPLWNLLCRDHSDEGSGEESNEDRKEEPDDELDEDSGEEPD